MLRSVQVCQGMRRRLTLQVASTSAPGVTYEVTVELVQGQVSCSCPGFHFRGTCNHTHLAEERCGWQAGAPGAEAQTAAQAAGHVCPRCGCPTHEVVTGVAGPSEVAEEDSEADLRARGVRVPMPPRTGR